MKKNIFNGSYIFFSIIALVVGEGIVLSLLETSIFSFYFIRDYFMYLVFIDILIYLGYALYLFIKKTLAGSDFYKLILPFLLNLSFILFVYFSFSFWIDEVVLVLVFLSNIFIFRNIEKNQKNLFNNFISFFVSLLLFFSVYSIFYNSSLPYWLLVTIVDLFLLLLVYYDLGSFAIEKKFLILYLVIFTILLSEFFLFSFFLPTNSILLKGLFMTFVYYLYWSSVDLYLNKKVSLGIIAKNLITFIFLILLIGVYSYLRGDLK